jgi:hypothetical protein
MDSKLLLEYATFTLIAVCCASLAAMWRRGILREFPLAAVLLGLQVLQASTNVSILYFRKSLHLPVLQAYHIYFWSNWSSACLQSILRIVIIYSVFRLLMRPLEGLDRIGRIIFRWVAIVSLVVSIGIALGPHGGGVGDSGAAAVFTRVVPQLQQGMSVLTLCLLLFVCFATKPLGLTYRSRAFGITTGLGVLAMIDLVQAAWLSTNQGRSVYSPMFLFTTLGMCAAFGIWGTYFAMPEPQRRLILLPTTSPFFFWNRISEVLGDHPGHVAIAGFHPEMLAAAEMDMFTAPSREPVYAEPDEVHRMPALQAAAHY